MFCLGLLDYTNAQSIELLNRNHFPLFAKYENKIGDACYYSITNTGNDTLSNIKVIFSYYSFSTIAKYNLPASLIDGEFYKKGKKVVDIKLIEPGAVQYFILPGLASKIVINKSE